MESASIQMAKNCRRADMNRAVECAFAEYQRELLEQYDIFALEGSYETGNYSEELFVHRLEEYGADAMEQRIKRIQFLTDAGAEGFYEQVQAYMEHKYGLDRVQNLMGMTEVWKAQEEQAAQLQKEELDKQGHLEGLLKEQEGTLPEENNPIASMEQLKKLSVLELVMPKDCAVSEKHILLEQTLENRSLNRGYGDFSDVADTSGSLPSLLLGEYLMEHFSMAAKTDQDTSEAGQRKGHVLDYELEYILAGKGSDRENLEMVVKQLLLMRFVPNYIYLQGNAAKRAEAEAAALTLCSVLMVPAVTEAAAQVILLAWAYGESLVDLRSLLAGNRVPFVKTDASWQLSLSGLLELGKAGDTNDGRDDPEGLRYAEYIRMLLFLENRQHTGLRTLDLIEQNLQKIEGLSFFRADQCILRVETESTCRLRRQITYKFPTYFGYQ